MWLTSSSVGRKFIMAVSGCALVLFVTFHCVMNSVAILWPTAYNMVCEFLGANWYALVGTAGLALLIAIHIIYACWLTVQNRRARGKDRYLITSRPKSVEWSSKNMLVLGFVVIAFMGLHLYQFWAKMQLPEVCGMATEYPAAAGTLFLADTFGNIWVSCVYVVAFIALWLHLTHGFWSMFQSIGWDSTRWIPRWKCIGCWWTSIVCLLFVAQVAVFTYNASTDYYKTNPELKAQYAEMIGGTINENFNTAYTTTDLDVLLDEINAELNDKIDDKGTLDLANVQEEEHLFFEKLFEARAQILNITACNDKVDEETQESVEEATPAGEVDITAPEAIETPENSEI